MKAKSTLDTKVLSIIIFRRHLMNILRLVLYFLATVA